MSNTTAPVHADNLLGICHALGEAFGINPIIPRIILICGLLFSAKLTLIAYLIAGLAVLIAHLCTGSLGKIVRKMRATAPSPDAA